MQFEISRRGARVSKEAEASARQILGSVIDHFAPQIDLMRVRLTWEGHPARAFCKVRAWSNDGPSFVVGSEGETLPEAVHTAAQILQKNIRRKKDRLSKHRDRTTPRKDSVLLPPGFEAEKTESPVVADAGRAIRKGNGKAVKIRPVLLILPAFERPKTALQRASSFAKILDAPLRVLGLISDGRINILFPQRLMAETMDILEIASAESKRIWRWCNKNLLNPLEQDNVKVMQGGFRSGIVEAIRKIRPQMIVIPDMPLLSGKDITDLADRLHTPILLSRHRQPGKAIIATTDFLNDKMPVLREGAAIGARLEVPVTFVHNVEPLLNPPALLSEGMFSMISVSDEDYADARRKRLQKASEEMGAKVRAKVLSEFDSIAAILGVARSKKADLIVVGHRHHSWFRRLFGSGVSVKIVSKARQSVLVVPIDSENEDAHQ